jgi:hypothetical protein
MHLKNKNTDALRCLSQIFTTSTFEKAVRDNDTKSTELRIQKHFPELKSDTTIKSLIKQIYSSLSKEYRNEYLYKNSLLNEYLLKKYSLKTTTVFHEFKVGNSVADFVLLNGTARIYEIKTDLDGLDKLEKQLSDYKQFADLVYIVTSSKYSSRILSQYFNSTIGVIEFTDTNTLKELKKAESNVDHFNHLTIFKTLRKSEYLEITEDYFGFLPDVPNTKIFRTCFDLVSKIDIKDFQKMSFNKLKKRKIRCPELLESNKTPLELKQICYTLDFSSEEYKIFFQFLNKPIDVFPILKRQAI